MVRKECFAGMEKICQGVGAGSQVFALILRNVAFQHDVRVVGITETGMPGEVVPCVFFLLEEARVLDGISEIGVVVFLHGCHADASLKLGVWRAVVALMMEMEVEVECQDEDSGENKDLLHVALHFKRFEDAKVGRKILLAPKVSMTFV